MALIIGDIECTSGMSKELFDVMKTGVPENTLTEVKKFSFNLANVIITHFKTNGQVGPDNLEIK